MAVGEAHDPAAVGRRPGDGDVAAEARRARRHPCGVQPRRAARSAHHALAVAPRSSSTPRGTSTVPAAGRRRPPASRAPARRRPRSAGPARLDVGEVAVVAEEAHGVDRRSGRRGRRSLGPPPARRRGRRAGWGTRARRDRGGRSPRSRSLSGRNRLQAASTSSMTPLDRRRAASSSVRLGDEHHGRRAERGEARHRRLRQSRATGDDLAAAGGSCAALVTRVIGDLVDGAVVPGVVEPADVEGVAVRGGCAAGVCWRSVAARRRRPGGDGSTSGHRRVGGCVRSDEAWVDAAARPAKRPTPATLPATSQRVTVPMRKMPSSRPSGECRRRPPCSHRRFGWLLRHGPPPGHTGSPPRSSPPRR